MHLIVGHRGHGVMTGFSSFVVSLAYGISCLACDVIGVNGVTQGIVERFRFGRQVTCQGSDFSSVAVIFCIAQ